MDAPVRCHHCGEVAGGDASLVELDGALAPMCCEGCAAAALFIRDAGLDDYYRLRQSAAARVDPQADDYEAWLHPDVQSQHVREVSSGSEITVVIDGMRCAACAWLIDRALAREHGVLEVAANAVTGRVRLRWDPARVALPALLRRLAGLGFAPHLATGLAREAARRTERRRDLLRLGVAALGALQAMMFAEALYLDTAAQMPIPTRDFLRWIALLVSTPVVFFAGWPFLAGAWRELRAHRPGMDALIGTSLLLAFGASVVETLRGGPQVWFDAAVMFVLLLLAARQLEAWARQRASARVDALARARPALAWREIAGGGRERVAASRLMPGDIVNVSCGEALPADGVLLGDALAVPAETAHPASVADDAFGNNARPASARSTRDDEAHPASACGERDDETYPAPACGTLDDERPPAAAADACGNDVNEPALVRAWLDESLLTGEAEPVARHAGDEVFAGSVCREQPLRLRVTRTGAQMLLSDLERLLERAQEQRPRVAQVADRIASWFVPAMFGAAAAAGIAWWQIDAARTVEIVLAVLAVSCPCALSLAVPAALAVAHGRLASIGVLSVEPDALFALAAADTAVFDKTGTLTRGRPELIACDVFDNLVDADRALRIAAGLQRGSGHVLAQAFAHRDPAIAEDVRNVPGFGLEGRIGDRRLRLGRAEFAAARADDGALWLGDGSRAFARFVVRDGLRPEAASTVAALKQAGFAIEICSGDSPQTVDAVAAAVHADAATARCTPADKLALLRARQAAGRRVLMIGDGINDAPVLAGADVSIAIGSGAALAHRAADFVLAGDTLTRIPQAIALARRARRVVRQNFAWALAYNLLALPFAACGLVTPWLAALGMAGSSLVVTLNALRIARSMPSASAAPHAATVAS